MNCWILLEIWPRISTLRYPVTAALPARQQELTKGKSRLFSSAAQLTARVLYTVGPGHSAGLWLVKNRTRAQGQEKLPLCFPLPELCLLPDQQALGSQRSELPAVNCACAASGSCAGEHSGGPRQEDGNFCRHGGLGNLARAPLKTFKKLRKSLGMWLTVKTLNSS